MHRRDILMSFRNAWHREESTVTCIACGEAIERSAAREYDKHGDRWDRDAKSFEHLCKPCDKARCHSPRNGLEADLVDAGAGCVDRETFLARYLDIVREGKSTSSGE